MIKRNLSMIVAMDKLGGIGLDNQLPWHIPADLQYFQKVTLWKPVIMGRKTFEAIGRPLKNRRNIVITRNEQWTAPGVTVVRELETALELVGNNVATVIGGGEIFKQAMPYVNTLYVTHIRHDYHCDTFFPQIDPTHWYENRYFRIQPDGVPYFFATYQRFSQTFFRELTHFVHGLEAMRGASYGSTQEFIAMADLIGKVAQAQTNGDALGLIAKFRYATRETLFKEIKELIEQRQKEIQP